MPEQSAFTTASQCESLELILDITFNRLSIIRRVCNYNQKRIIAITHTADSCRIVSHPWYPRDERGGVLTVGCFRNGPF
jgi:hypothetical protein